VTESPEFTGVLVPEPDPTPRQLDPMLALVDDFMRSGRSPEEGRAFFDLVRDMRKEKAKTAYHEAMNRAQKRMPVVVRDAKNTQTNSRYAKFDTVLRDAKPIINEEGFSLTFGEEDCPYQDTCPGPTPESPPLILRWKRTKLTIMHKDGHAETETLDLPVDGIGPKGNPIGGMNKVQGAISTGSYAQRVMICRAFNIAIADTDLDGGGPVELTDVQRDKLTELWTAAEQACVDAGVQKASWDKYAAWFLKWMEVEKLDAIHPAKFQSASLELVRKAREPK
jgi:hypothetical protein